MVYAAPDLMTLRAGVARDLRDISFEVFSSLTMDDFINAGLGELNLIRPIEVQVTIPGADLAQTIPTTDFGDMTHVFMVEMNVTPDTETFTSVIPVNDPATPFHRNGWDLFGGYLDLGRTWWEAVDRQIDHHGAAALGLRVSGYADRVGLSDDADVAQLASLQEETFLRRYAQVTGFKTLESDRALYQQWNASSNSTDVSPTQLTNMRANVESEVRRMARAMHRSRRPAVMA